MIITTKAYIFRDKDHIEEYIIEVNDNNFRICLERLKYEHKKIINLLKDYKEQGIIKTLCKPRNKKIQEELDKLIEINKELRASIINIKVAFK